MGIGDYEYEAHAGLRGSPLRQQAPHSDSGTNWYTSPIGGFYYRLSHHLVGGVYYRLCVAADSWHIWFI